MKCLVMVKMIKKRGIMLGFNQKFSDFQLEATLYGLLNTNKDRILLLSLLYFSHFMLAINVTTCGLCPKALLIVFPKWIDAYTIYGLSGRY